MQTKVFALLLTLILASSCCKNDYPQGGVVPPLWSTNLIIGNFPYTAHHGVVGYPKYGNDIIFHTTLYDDDDLNQDNRLVGLDATTGQIKWIFPKDTSKRYNYAFDGSGYLYGDHLVVKNWTTTGHSKRKNELLGINLRTLEFDWIIDHTAIEGLNWSDVYGYGDYAYNVESTYNSESRIFRTNVATGDTTTIYRISATEQYTKIFIIPNGICTINGTPLLIFSEYHGVPDVWRPENPAARKVVRSFNLLTGEFKDIFAVFDKSGTATWGVIQDDYFLWDVGNTMYCIDIPTGKLVWTYAYPNFTLHEIVVCSGVALGIGSNEYFGIDLATGRELYLNKQIGNYKTSITDGRMVYMNILGKIWVVDPRSGSKVAELMSVDHNNDGSFRKKPAIHDDKMYITSIYKAYCYSLYPW